MIWIIVIILCLLWCLSTVYTCLSMNKIKRLKDELDEYVDDYKHMHRQYYYAIGEIQKDFGNIEQQIDNQRKITNGWGHKIDIIDRELKKLKKVLMSVVSEDKLDLKE